MKENNFCTSGKLFIVTYNFLASRKKHVVSPQQNPQAEEPGEAPQHMDHKEISRNGMVHQRSRETFSSLAAVASTVLEYILLEGKNCIGTEGKWLYICWFKETRIVTLRLHETGF